MENAHSKEMRAFQAPNRASRVVRATDSTGLLVGVVETEPYTISKKSRKQRRCDRSYRDNHYKHYSSTTSIVRLMVDAALHLVPVEIS